MYQVMYKKNKIISASILAANLTCLGLEINQVVNAGVDWIHIDVMDNHFVPNLTFGPWICGAIKNYALQNDLNLTLDVHLMASPIDNLIKECAQLGADYITIHPEATNNLQHLQQSLQLIKSYGSKVGLALNPDTEIDIIKSVYKQLDLILVMSVYPGFAGQKFIVNSLAKVKAINSMLQELNHVILLGIDGGVNKDNIELLAKNNIDVFTIGTGIFKSNQKNDYKSIMNNLKKMISFC